MRKFVFGAILFGLVANAVPAGEFAIFVTLILNPKPDKMKALVRRWERVRKSFYPPQ